MKTLALVLRPDFGRRLGAVASSLTPLPAPRARAEEVGEALGGEGDREEDEDEDGGGEARLALGRPTRSTAVAISQTRPSVVAAMMPIAFWRLPAPSSAWARRPATIWMPRWSEPGSGADGVAEHRQTSQQKHSEGGGEHE